MRISDWSSDVCSSDLVVGDQRRRRDGARPPTRPWQAHCNHPVRQRVSLSLDALQSRMAGEQRTGGGMKTHGPIEAVGAAVSPPPAVLTPAHETMRRLQIEIGRASWRARGWQYV